MTGDFFLTQWAFLAMRWLFENVAGQSIVLTVIIATLAIRGATVFGDIKSRKSSMQMQAIQPQLQKLQKKYEKDPQRMNVEQQKLMKENHVSMFGGCLPMLLTLPMFFIFIAAFRQWGNEHMARLIVELDKSPEAGIELFKTFRFAWINNMWAADNGIKPVVMSATEFFSKNMENLPRLLYFTENPEALNTFARLGFFVEQNGSYVMAASSDQLVATYNALVQPCIDYCQGHSNGLWILPLLAGVTTFFSSWLMMRKQPKVENNTAGGTNKIMQYLMPLMSVWVCWSSNAAFALYWTTSNVFSMASTAIINYAFDKEKKVVEVKKQ